ncbi:hypothetical protein M1271_06540 [Patescibacteria group bacterium]|nr:hypothetical protein [Patescibacteria group bacterium]
MNKDFDYKKYIPLLKKYEIIIASSIVIFVVVVMTFLLLIPNFDRAQNIYAQQQDLKRNRDVLQKKVNSLASIDAQYYKNNFAKIDQVLPTEKDYVSLFYTFDTLEQKTNVSLLKTDFQLGVISTNSAQLTRVPGSSAYVLPVGIQVLGSLSSIQNFIKALGDFSGRYITVDSFQIETKGGDAFIATLVGKAYFYPLPATLGSVDTPLPNMNSDEEKILNTIAKIQQTSSEEYSLPSSAVGKKNLFQ